MMSTIYLTKKVFESSSSEEEEKDNASDEELFIILNKQHEKHAKIRDYIYSVVPKYNEMDLKAHFRLTKDVVETMMEDLQLKPLVVKTKPEVSPLLSFLLMLWVLANQEPFRSVGDRFGLGRGHAHHVFIKICKRIYNAKRRYIKWPQNHDFLRTVVTKFNELRGNFSFPNVIGCVDGTHVLIPAQRDDNSFYNRKGTHSMLVQGICDADMVFTDIYCGWPGSTHDSRMWQESPIYNRLKNHPVSQEFHLLGDTAYPLDTFIMVPFKDNGHLSLRQKRFNQILSSTRVVIEQAFGRLKGLWRRLKFLDIKNLKYFKYIVITSCILHNVCIREGIEYVNIDLAGFVDEELDAGNFVEHVPRGNASRNKRETLALEFERR